MVSRNRTVAVLFACALGTAVARAQTTYFVDGSCGDDAWTGSSPICQAPNGPKQTIQAGIDASLTGDTVIVADGVYTAPGNRDLDFGGRDIHLRSESLDPTLCIIDCQGTLVDPHRGLYFHNGETAEAILDGFTIVNGYVYRENGGGILCEGSSPTITNCRLERNVSIGGWNGGGIAADSNSGPTISHCEITGNMGWRGGGIRAQGNTTITDCIFVGNFGIHDGGGVYALDNTTVTNCTIIANTAMYDNGKGGGIFAADNTAISDCWIVANVSREFGGGISIAGGTITNCEIVGNTSRYGGGVNVRGGPILISNCTIAENEGRDGGGLYCQQDAEVRNSILWGNTASGNGPQIAVVSRAISVAYSDVAGGRSRVWVNGGSLLWGTGNIALAPRFQNRSEGDFRLKPISPCIDAADNTAVPPGILTDLDGNPRFVDDPDTPDTGVPGGPGGSAIVDMGAYEYQGIPCDPCDMNCDGDINAFDIEPFLELLFDPTATPCDSCTGDVNGDGNIDAFDIEPFLDCLFP